MCSSKPLEVAAMAVAPAVAVPYFMQKRQMDKMASQQQDQINAQNARDAELKKEADALGPAAKAIDLTRKGSAYEDLKKNKIAMQAGILGTVKTSQLSSAPTATTQKTTLGT
jgi:hypothetical protein